MPSHIGSPHDRFVRRCLDDLDLAKSFFRKFLSPKYIENIDMDGLKPGGKDSFVGKDLNEVTTDLFFQAPFHDRPAYLSLLVEHKSEGAARGDGPILPFQMRNQEIMIMDYGRRNHPKKRFPLVHMVGLYHGDRPYSGPLSVGEHIDAPENLIPDRWREHMVLIDLSAYRDEDLLVDGKLGVFLLVLKHIYSTDILQTLESLSPYLRKVEEGHGDEFILTLFRYLYEAAKVENQAAVNHIAKKAFTREMGEKIMTIAEKLIEEGLEKGRIKFAKKMIAKGDSIENIQEMTELSLEQIQALQNED